MRTFYLENERVERYNLQDLKNNALLVMPAGLGLAISRSYTPVGNSATVTSERFEPRSFSGVIVFDAPVAYSGYFALSNFIANATHLKLAYTPQNEEYLADIEVDSLSKSDVSGGRMECDISIMLKSAWYKRGNVRVVAESSGEELRYDRIYDFVYSDVSTDFIEVNNDGHFPASISLESEGPLVNPELALYVDGALFAKLAVTAVIAEGEKLLYSSKDAELSLKKVLANGTEVSLIESISLENDNFFKLPIGLSVLSLTADNALSGQSVITLYIEYKAV